jgi:hypothetical protein
MALVLWSKRLLYNPISPIGDMIAAPLVVMGLELFAKVQLLIRVGNDGLLRYSALAILAWLELKVQ